MFSDRNQASDPITFKNGEKVYQQNHDTLRSLWRWGGLGMNW